MTPSITLVPCGDARDRYQTSRVLLSLGDAYWITEPSGYNPLYFNCLYDIQIKYVGDLQCELSKEYFKELCDRYSEDVFISVNKETHFVYLTARHTTQSFVHHHIIPVYYKTHEEMVEELL